MARFKQVALPKGFQTELSVRPVVLTVQLTPEQQKIVFGQTGKNIQSLELSREELGVVVSPSSACVSFPTAR